MTISEGNLKILNKFFFLNMYINKIIYYLFILYKSNILKRVLLNYKSIYPDLTPNIIYIYLLLLNMESFFDD